MQTAHYAVATANPLATQAACEVLRDGGTAADALVTAQAVLGLVEPQASGIGGGGFLLYYDAAAGSVEAYDGREVAPAAATENYLRWVSDTDRTEPKPDARASGRSIGVPGIVRMLSDVHDEHGKSAWRDLFSPAARLADDGFDISPRLATAIADAAPKLRVDEQAAAYFLNPDGSPKAAGTRLTNPAYSKTLGAIASGGADGVLHRGHRSRHRRVGDRRLRRPHSEPDDDGGPGRLHRQEARAAVHRIPGPRDLRHAAAVVGRHRGGRHAGNARALRHGRSQTHRRRPQRRQARRDGSSPDLGGREAGVRRPRPLRRRHRLRAAAGRLTRHAAEQCLPGRAGCVDLRAAHHGNCEARRIRCTVIDGHTGPRARHQPDQRRRRCRATRPR